MGEVRIGPGIHAAAAASRGAAPAPADSDQPSFLEFLLDTLNPLQHIPGISTLYRRITGDEAVPAARVIGGMIFGGAIGFLSNAVDVVVEAATGKAAGEHIATAFLGDDESAPPTPQVLAEATVAADDPAGDDPAPGGAVAPAAAGHDANTDAGGTTALAHTDRRAAIITAQEFLRHDGDRERRRSAPLISVLPLPAGDRGGLDVTA